MQARITCASSFSCIKPSPKKQKKHLTTFSPEKQKQHLTTIFTRKIYNKFLNKYYLNNNILQQISPQQQQHYKFYLL
jgi:hypothetical protein